MIPIERQGSDRPSEDVEVACEGGPRNRIGERGLDAFGFGGLDRPQQMAYQIVSHDGCSR